MLTWRHFVAFIKCIPSFCPWRIFQHQSYKRLKSSKRSSSGTVKPKEEGMCFVEHLSDLFNQAIHLCLPFISVGIRDWFRLEKICLLCTYLHSTYLHSYSHFSRPWVASLHLRTLAGCTFHQSQISENRSTFTSKVSKKGIESMRVKVDCRRRCGRVVSEVMRVAAHPISWSSHGCQPGAWWDRCLTQLSPPGQDGQPAPE